MGWGRGLLGKRAPSPAPAPRSRAGRGRTLVGVGLADALSRLEGVEGVGEVHVRIRLVHQPVQHVHGFHDRHSFVGEAPELGMLGQDGTGQLGPGRRARPVPLCPLGAMAEEPAGTFFLTKSTVCCVCMSL